MLDKSDLLALFDQLGLPSRGRKLTLDARIHAPVRQVVSRSSNVITILASRKMQRDVHTESRHIEFPAALRYEYDDAVLEYYPQPCELKLELVDDVDGEPHRIAHVPDFLVLREDRIELIEWKSRARLERLAERQPWRYRRDEDGNWSAPGIEQQVAEWGLVYRICTDGDLNPRWTENMLALADYFHPGAEACPDAVLARIHSALVEESSLYLADLYDEPYSFMPDQVLKAIADRQLVANLDGEDLTQPRRARVFRDGAVMELLAGYDGQSSDGAVASYQFPIAAGVAFAFEGQRYVIALVGDKNLVLSDGNGAQTEISHDWLHERHAEGRLVPEANTLPRVQEALSHFSEAELKEALNRQKVLEREDGASDRSKRRWRQMQLAAQINGGNEILALVSRARDRGNRTPRLDAEQEALLQRVIEKEWLSHRAQNYQSCHRHLKSAFDAAGLEPPSYPTLIARIKALDLDHSTRVRHGKRRAYQEADFVHVLYQDTPVHGSRPFQYCHVDHTQLDIELVCSRTGKNLGRPWFSLAIDSFTRRIIGIYLSFDPPSYVATMMVLRDIVRRHHRLPQFLVVDNGSDFRSGNLKQFLEALGTHLRFRPSGQPRHGAVLERLFGRAHSEYVHNLAGNTKATKQVRMTTGKFLPQRLAEWTLEAMYYGLEHWAFDYYDQTLHHVLGLSPREAHAKGIAESGARAHMHLVCNTDFLIATCPAVDREGLRKVDRQRGVKFNDFYYWAPEFRDLKIAGTKVRVRFDPWDAGSVYAEVNQAWVRCQCNTLARLGGLTDAECKALSEEYRQRSGIKPDTALSMQRLIEFLQTFTPEGAMALHQARQAENKTLYGGLNQAWVSPPASRPALHHLAQTPMSESESNLPVALTTANGTDELPEFDTF
jgi:putative transposase